MRLFIIIYNLSQLLLIQIDPIYKIQYTFYIVITPFVCQQFTIQTD